MNDVDTTVPGSSAPLSGLVVTSECVRLCCPDFDTLSLKTPILWGYTL